jgi:putative tryptophan/tyrosine transport system substrate-binding protein
MRRRDFIAGLGGAATWPAFRPSGTLAQQPARPVIGYLSTFAAIGLAPAAFRKGLAEAGFIEGQNVAIEYRWTEGRTELVPSLVKDLVDRPVSVIVIIGNTSAALAAKAATQTVPTVVVGAQDPVGSGLVASLARPGGNVTGIVSLTAQLGPKRLEMLRALLPAGTTVILLANPANPNSSDETKEIIAAGRLKDLRLVIVNTSSALDIYDAFAGIAQQQIGGILTTADALFLAQQNELVALAARKSVAAIGLTRAFTEAGGLMSYGPDIYDGARLGGVYAGRILKGAKPADLPVQQATKIELIINMKTAKTLGLTFPLTILGRADAAIE